MPVRSGNQRPRTLFAILTALIVVVAVGCVGFIEASGPHDTFAWWAEIIIPSLVGAATVVVSYAAFVASRRATDLAHELERQRELGEQTRSADERKRRLQDMALEEARALTAWAVVAMDDRHWSLQDLEKVGEAKHGPALQHRALVMLQQSIVPGASELFELTEFEISNHFRYKPDGMYMPDRRVWAPGASAKSEIVDTFVPVVRRRRVLDRIRSWALDPEGVHARLVADHQGWLSDPAAHMDYRRGLGRDDLPPLSELEKPPAMSADRIVFFRAKGLLPET